MQFGTFFGNVTGSFLYPLTGSRVRMTAFGMDSSLSFRMTGRSDFATIKFFEF